MGHADVLRPKCRPQSSTRPSQAGTPMTSAELVRYNLTRLVEASGREPVAVALAAWPLPESASARLLGLRRRDRTKRLLRYMSGKREPSKAALDDLARALEVPVIEFFRPQQN
jgi:transcriptional regulator with XRE-family HTH domain